MNVQEKRGSIQKVSVALCVSVLDVPFARRVRIELVVLEWYGYGGRHELGCLAGASSRNHRVLVRLFVVAGGRCKCHRERSSAACGADVVAAVYKRAAGGGRGRRAGRGSLKRPLALGPIGGRWVASGEQSVPVFWLDRNEAEQLQALGSPRVGAVESRDETSLLFARFSRVRGNDQASQSEPGRSVHRRCVQPRKLPTLKSVPSPEARIDWNQRRRRSIHRGRRHPLNDSMYLHNH